VRIRGSSGVSTLLALLFVVLNVTPARAATVIVQDFSFSPHLLKLAQGGSVDWDNGGPHTHTSTQNGSLALWDTGNIPSGTTSSSVTLKAAGSYPYHCSIHPDMHGVVKVPVKVSPSSGSPSTTFTITLTSATQSGFTYDVQKKVGSGSWTNWKTGVTNRRVRFSGSNGHYAFRSRLHRTSDGAKSGWSPPKSITIS
jgi:plastocyanin